MATYSPYLHLIRTEAVLKLDADSLEETASYLIRTEAVLKLTSKLVPYSDSNLIRTEAVLKRVASSK